MQVDLTFNNVLYSGTNNYVIIIRLIYYKRISFINTYICEIIYTWKITVHIKIWYKSTYLYV